MKYQRLNKANKSERDHHPATGAKSTAARQQTIFRQLQHAIGNRAVGHSIQAKLKISEPGDVHEREADRVADEVMRMPEPGATQETAATEQLQAPKIQRLCTDCQEQAMRAMAEGEEEKKEEEQAVQMKEAPGRSSAATSAAPAGLGNMTAGGQSLSDSTRAYFEPRFGHDFGHVRIHNDQSAAESAESVSAKAYTLGRDIVFGAGEFAPDTTEGRRLLTHELVHVVQQGGASPRVSASRGRNIDRSLQSSGNNILQRIPKDPTDAPFEGEIIPWSAALRSKPKSTADVVADLPRGHLVTVLGGTAWISVRTHIDNLDRVGFVSHELIKKNATSLPTSFVTDVGNPIS
ncbi:MAG: eCIS core domain-containing protein, partial [Burkholderiales bacterium]